MYARIALSFTLVAAAACGSGGSRDESEVAITSDVPYAGACAHGPCSTGGKLTSSCDPCVGEICARDSYCCHNKWDAQCVREVGSICGQSCSKGGRDMASGGAVDLASGGAVDMSLPAPDLAGGGGGLLKFAVFGDSRPPSLNDTSGYPSSIIGGIFALAQQHGAQFIVGTGDYMFASTSSAVSAQVQLFEQARAGFSGPAYLAMGNHECNGYTSSNCPNLDETPNVQAFLGLLPSGVSQPYYRIDVPTPNGTAKLLFVAANAWTTAQQTWLQQELAQPTPYTFVVRHEPAADTTAPGVSPSESLIKAASYTLELNGHTHEYRRVDTKHVISGNAGAPLQSGAYYGLLIVEQQANGNITVTEYDESTGAALDSWTVTPTGQAG